MDAGLAAALALLALPAAPPLDGAIDVPSLELLWVESAPAGAAPCPLPALLDLPPGWRIGDAAAVLLSLGGAAPDARRTRLASALREAGAAVLELTSGGECVREGPGHALPREPVADLFGGLRALGQHAGAGLVVAIGLGAAGPVALQAAARDAAGRSPLGAERARPGFAAAAAIGDGEGMPAVAHGAPSRPEERWALRGKLFCGILERVAAAGPDGGRDAGVPGGEACLEHLAPAVRSRETSSPP